MNFEDLLESNIPKEESIKVQKKRETSSSRVSTQIKTSNQDNIRRIVNSISLAGLAEDRAGKVAECQNYIAGLPSDHINRLFVAALIAAYQAGNDEDYYPWITFAVEGDGILDANGTEYDGEGLKIIRNIVKNHEVVKGIMSGLNQWSYTILLNSFPAEVWGKLGDYFSKTSDTAKRYLLRQKGFWFGVKNEDYQRLCRSSKMVPAWPVCARFYNPTGINEEALYVQRLKLSWDLIQELSGLDIPRNSTAVRCYTSCARAGNDTVEAKSRADSKYAKFFEDSKKGPNYREF